MVHIPEKNPPEETKKPPIDLAPFQRAVNEAESRVRGLWIGYIALVAYLFIAIGAVTHLDLLLANPIKLPVLNVELPLIGFFAVAPALFLVNHFYVLLQLLGLSRRIREFNDELAIANLDNKSRRRERRRLDTFIIVQMLAQTRQYGGSGPVAGHRIAHVRGSSEIGRASCRERV